MGKSELLTDELRMQLKTILSKMNREVKLVTVMDVEDAKSKELELFLEDIAELGDKLTLEKYDKTSEELSLKDFDISHLPLIALYEADGTYTGVAFHGVPGGKELNSFVAALVNCSGAGQAPDKYLKKNIDAIKRETRIKIFVSLACHHCPHVVAACQKVAYLNPNVEAHMYDANLYPDLVEKYKVERVPMMVVNDADVYYGKKEIAEIVNLLNMTKK